jgi:YidC/Oxa1 family membrane protein insertase
MLENNVKPLQGAVLPLIQLGIFIPFFLGVRGLATAHYPGLETGGFGWITDLTAPDPYWILPVSSAVTTLAVIQVCTLPPFFIEGNRHSLTRYIVGPKI